MKSSRSETLFSAGERLRPWPAGRDDQIQPGALGDEGSATQDSLTDGLLHAPEYTRLSCMRTGPCRRFY